MKLLLHVIALTIFNLFSFVYQVRGQIHINLSIDTICECADNNLDTIQGTFALYEVVPNRPYSSELMDTLVKRLDYIHFQKLVLGESRYKLIFIPFDSTKKSNIHYFHTYPNIPDIHLNCFFFNKNYPPFLDQMNEEDSLIFYTSYFGKTHEEMLIPAHQVSIFRKQNTYYAAYSRCDYYSHDPILTRPSVGKALILLTEKEVTLIREFQLKIRTAVIKDNTLEYPKTHHRIYLRDQQILFYSKSSINESLYTLLHRD